ncbi:hypothetical protein BOX15_Mlig000600g2, partial [Macrostomum lignano]
TPHSTMVPPCNNGEESGTGGGGTSSQLHHPEPARQPPQLTIAYGSETGVAQDAALTLYNFARSHGLNCRFGSLDEVGIVALETAADCLPSNDLRQQLLIAACSTTGQGDPPANMRKFWRLAMSRRLTQGCLHGNGSSQSANNPHGNGDSATARLRFCLIGFGDSSYLQYNFVAKKLHRRLCLLGANSACPLALANDQDELGPDQAFLPFAETVSALLTDTFSVRCACVGSCLDAPLPPLYRVEAIAAEKSTDSTHTTAANQVVVVVGADGPRLPPPETGYQLARIVANKRVTAEDHFQDTRLITLSPAPTSAESPSPTLWSPFQPGDVLQVLPSNSQSAVSSLLSTLSHLDPETRLRVSQSDPNFPPPPDLPPAGPTLRWLLTNYFDISCVPRRSFFETLRRIAMCIGDEVATTTEEDSSRLDMEIERLGEFVRDVDELAAYCNRPRRTVAETLRDFPVSASRIRLSRLFDLLRPIQPRSFSIASLGQSGCSSLDLLVAVVRYKSKLMSEPRLGLCSNYLASAGPGSVVTVRLQRGTLRVPPVDVPLVLVGPGTGIAPFRGLVQQRHGVVNGQGDEAPAAGSAQTLVFFGCRHPEKDFYFQSDWLEWSRLWPDKFQLATAFSRPTSDSGQQTKCYVQDRIRELGADVAKLLLLGGGAVIVAGSSGAMPREVLSAVQAALTVHGGFDEAEAAGMLAEWQRTGRYQMETWS